MDSDDPDYSESPQAEIKYYRDVLKCFVPSCMKYRRDFPNVAYLSIPKCLQATWCQALGRNCPKRNLYVCEEHINIEEDCYKSKSDKLCLKKTANLILTKTYDKNDPEYQRYKDPKTCFIPTCSKSDKKNPSLKFFGVRKELKENWCQLVGRDCPKRRIDHLNFEEDLENYSKWIAGATPRLKLNATLKNYLQTREKNVNLTQASTSSAVADVQMIHSMSEQDAQSEPSKSLGRKTPSNSSTSREQDPLIRVIEQCRFCGEFSKDYVAVSDNMSYLASDKIMLALNDTSVQIDFNDNSLPKTVCRDCDAKLQEICDFLQVVKAAQTTLINVAQESRTIEETGGDSEETRDLEDTIDQIEERESETEMLVVKTEYDSQEDSDDDKEGIVDSLPFGETVFVKENVNHKRKSDTDTGEPKKLKAKEICEDIALDIKEEFVENDANDGQGRSEASDTGTDVKPSEVELATSALMFKMADDRASEYQGYRSNR